MPRKSEPKAFEESLAELDEIVSKMESGDLSLEESLSAFEKGIKLTSDCQTALQAAEQKVSQLLEKEDNLSIEPFTANLEDDK